jgi:precorrin-3B C17-methyltransferase
MSGKLFIIGLGPGPAHWSVPEALDALEQVSDIIGYGPYVARIAPRPDQTVHGSDNRVEIDRAIHALSLVQAGKKVAVVSGGDPGVFAMAAAVLEAVEAGPSEWRALDIHIVPGISAMQAAAARLGAPLGHDFCAISLSDNLKPWSIIEKRLITAAQGDFVISLYNPASKARPNRIYEAFTVLSLIKNGETPVAFARAVGRPDEHLHLTTLGEANLKLVDMSTLVIIGSSESRWIIRPQGAPWLLTPRSYGIKP